MNKAELAQTLSTTNGLSKVEAAKIVNLFFDQMAAALEKGDRVEIRGLGRGLRLRRRNCPILNVGRG